MSTATESNTPQPYAQGTYSTPNVGTPSHGLVQPGQQNGTHSSTTGLQSNTLDSQSQSQIHSPSQSQRSTNDRTPATVPASSQPVQTQDQNGFKKQEVGREQPAEEEGGAARGESAGQGAPTEPEGGYPEQIHAGHLDGVGPEYASANRVTMGERIQGMKEKVKGTIKRDPGLKQQGQERMTGELKRKQKEKDEGTDPFQNPEDEKKDKKDEEPKDDGASQTSKKRRSEMDTDETETGTTANPSSHPTDEGAHEQAASVKPEGAGSNDVEMQARNKAEDGQSPPANSAMNMNSPSIPRTSAN